LHWYGLPQQNDVQTWWGGTTNYKEKNFGGEFGQQYCPCCVFPSPALDMVTFLKQHREDSKYNPMTQVQGSPIKVCYKNISYSCTNIKQ
jgi:hypothetical protein